jgi:hypothetical protein
MILLSGVLLVGCETHQPFGDDLSVRLIAPLAGAGTGSPNSAVAGKPTLRWTSSSAAQTYQVQVDDSCDLVAPCTFPSPEIDDSAVATTSYVPASPLVVSSTVPRRQRYHWRVRACRDGSCGEWSSARYFVVGQDLAINRDLNGDGYSDFLIGSPNSSAVLSQAGQAFVYLGGPRLPVRPALVINSDVPVDQLGHAVAVAGDVNGDGFGDFLVQTTGNNMSVGTQSGRVLLFFGGVNLKAQPDIKFAGGNVDDANGPMTGCGDLNGDGYDDIAFAATDIDAQHQAILPARVEIHFGGPAMATSAPLVLLGESATDFFGSSISAAGDVNGDGYPDLIVGSHQGVSGGRVRIYFGGSQMDATPDVILESPADAPVTGLFGYSVAGVGDVNGDGFADVAVGARDGNEFPASLGRVYVYYGGSPPHTTPDLVFMGNYQDEYFGQAVVFAGDLNHDGYANIAVLARGIPTGEADVAVGRTATQGRVYFYLGGEHPIVSPVIENGTAPITFPSSIRLAAFDIDGDAEPEILTGQLANYGSSPVTGQVSIYQRSNNYAAPALTISAASSDDWFGFALSR